MENKMKFFVVLVICAVLAGATMIVYQGKYGSISLSGFVMRKAWNENVNWPLIALVGQWVLLVLALVIASFHYLHPYHSKY